MLEIQKFKKWHYASNMLNSFWVFFQNMVSQNNWFLQTFQRTLRWWTLDQFCKSENLKTYVNLIKSKICLKKYWLFFIILDRCGILVFSANHFLNLWDSQEAITPHKNTDSHLCTKPGWSRSLTEWSRRSQPMFLFCKQCLGKSGVPNIQT